MKRGIAARRDDLQAARAIEAPTLRLVHDASGIAAHAGGRAWLCGVVDRLIGASSLASTAPLLNVRDFAWTAGLRAHWAEIRRECAGVTGDVSPARHPATAAILSGIPALHAARFEWLAPGGHVAVRRLADRALLTCHLGLAVPRDGDPRMRLGGRTIRWAEGETMLFDATRAQGWRNDGSEPGLILCVELRRPLRRPARWLADALLR